MARLKKKSKPFDPSKPSFKTEKQFRKAVKNRAKAQVQPLLQDIKQRKGEAVSANRARESDIDKYYGYDLGARQSAYDKINTALNGLITGNAGLTEASRDALAAALRGSAGRENEQAALLGAAPTQNPEAAIRAAGAMGDVSTLGTLGNVEAFRGEAARGIGASGIAHREAGETEGARFNAIMKALAKERTDVRSRLPGIREDVRQTMLGEESQRAAQGFQQELASDQFDFQKKESGRNFRLQKRGQKFQEDLAERQQTETERANKAGERINMAGVRNERARIKQEVDNAGDDTTREEAKARGERFNAGIEILTSWFKPTKQETGKGGRMGPQKQQAYEQRLVHGYSEMLQQLMASTGMGPLEARQVILAAADRTSEWGKRWVARAQREIGVIKLNRERKKAGVKGPPTPVR